MRTLLLVLVFSVAVRAEDTVRLGNLKFAHYGAVSHMKEVCPKYGIKLEERMFAKGLDIVPGILAGEIDLAASALDGAIAGRASGAPVFVVAGFAKGGARILARKNGGIGKSRALAAFAARQGVACSIGSNLEWDVGTAAMAHLVVACPNLQVEKYPGDMLGPDYHEVRLVQNPIPIRGPLVTLTDRPGLGIDVDWPVVRAHAC